MNGKKLILHLVCVACVAALPLVFRGSFTLHVFILILIWSILGMGWNFLGGYAGQVSIGHSVFYGIGAYSVAISYKMFALTPWISLFIGVLLSVVVAVLIGFPLLRLKGHYFAVATMATAECFRVVFVNWKAIGGATGVDFLNKKDNPWYSLQFTDKIYYFYLFLAIAFMVMLLTFHLDRSRFGFYLRTIRGNDQAAESVGIDTTRYKISAYMLSASIVSLGGSLYATYMLYVDPTMLMTLKISLMICLVTVMGGMGTVYGPILGAVVLTLISEYSRVLLGGSGRGIDQLLYGILVIICVLYLPNGIISLPHKKIRGPKPDGKEATS